MDAPPRERPTFAKHAVMASAGDAAARKHKIGPVNANSETIRK